MALGIPQLCLPKGTDQFLNAAASTSAGAGLSIPPALVTGDAVPEAVSRLLAEASFRRSAAAVRESIDSMPTAVDVAPTLEALA